MTFFSDTAKHTNLRLGKCDRVSGQSHRLETCYKNGYMCNEEEKNNAVIQLATGLMTFAHLFLKLTLSHFPSLRLVCLAVSEKKVM
jgi:hypothetical protein